MKSPTPFLNSKPQKPGREGTYSRCLPCVLQMYPAVGVYVCVVLPFPMPCMTCDAADTTILCAGVCWGH